MSKRIVEPPDIERIFDKPGREWTEDERNRVKEWLNSPPQIFYLRLLALRHLGRGATIEDAEDAWSEFNVKELDRVIDSYEPGIEGGLRFWAYLELCLKRFCWKEGKRIREHRSHESPLESQVEIEAGETIEFEIKDIHTLSPEDQLLLKERVRILQQCLNKLSGEDRRVILMHHIDELSFSKIAESLGGSSGALKTRCCRARQEMALCLRKEGITS